MASDRFLKSITELAPLFEGAAHVDIKTIDGDIGLRQFIAGLLGYTPGWLKALYTIRAGFVRLLGMRQENVDSPPMTPESVSFTPGDPCAFFTVTHGSEEEYLAAEIRDKHLEARLLIAAESLPDNLNRFHVGTIVFYKHWTGPVYFAVVKPFHHLVVWLMMRAGIKR